MSNNWNEAQRTAIDSRGGAVLVSAGAGSGKTSVLVERALRMIAGENAVPADRMLIITFTNAAAAELKGRLYTALDRLCAENPKNEAYRAQKIAVRRATICTIHAFCGELIRENFDALDIPPDYRIADSLVMAAMSNAAMEDALNAMYADSEDFVRLSGLFGRARNDRTVVELILKLQNFLSCQPNAAAYRENCLEQLDMEFTKTDFYRRLADTAEEYLNSAIRLCAAARAECGENGDFDAKYGPALESRDDAARKTLNLLTLGEYERAGNLLRDYDFVRVKARPAVDAQDAARMNALMKGIKSLLDSARDRCFCGTGDAYREQAKKLKGPISALFAAQELYDTNLNARKFEKKLFEFADLEKYALELLVSPSGVPTPVAERVAARFDCVMIDEYQDTNEIQNTIFRAVCRGNMGNAFMVGDVKQSIYGFRNAEPDIIVNLAKRCVPYGKGFPAHIHLNENYRSTREVADGINAVFDRIMTERTCNVDYRNEQRLVCGGGQSSSDGVGLELVLVDDPELESQAEYIAGEIQRLVDSGHRVNDGKGGLRPVWYSDFAVLLRSAKDRMATFSAALERRGIPCSAVGLENFFERREIAELMAALEAVNNPRRDIALASLMVSARFGFDADELLKLRNTDRKAPLYSLLLKNRDDGRVAQVLDFLGRMRTAASLLPVDEFVARMTGELSLEYLALARPNGEKRLESVRAFAEYAASVRAAQGVSLSGFLKLAAQAKESGKAPDAAQGLVKNAVAVCSIHKAKGLEWPIVFLANCEKDPNTEDLRKAVLFNTRLGIGAKYIGRDELGEKVLVRTAAHAAIVLEETRRMSAEELRLFYVALTRARDRAVIVGEAPKADKLIELEVLAQKQADGRFIADLGSYLELSLAALFMGKRATAKLLSEACDKTADGIRVLRVSPEKAEVHSPEPAPVPPADTAKADELVSRFSFSYPNAALCGIPAKMSVSLLTKLDGEPSVKRPSFAGLDGMSAAERGTAIHAFMQYANYESAKISVKDEIERLVELMYIDGTLADGIDAAALEKLFNSEFMGEIIGCERVLREYEFFFPIDACELGGTSAQGGAKVMLQGIADCVCVYADGAVIIDYKSDRVSSPQQLRELYSAQLAVYKRAVEARLGVNVKRCALYSFALGCAVDLAL